MIKNILIHIPLNHPDDDAPQIGSMYQLRERGGEGRSIEAQVTAHGAQWSNSATGEHGRWIRVDVPADWAGTADLQEHNTANDTLAEAAAAERRAADTLVSALSDVIGEGDVETIRQYPAEVSLEWNFEGGSHQYEIQIGRVVRVSGQIRAADSWFDSGGVPLDASMDHRNERAQWTRLTLGASAQQAVHEFARQILRNPCTARQAAEAHVAAIRQIVRRLDQAAINQYPADVSFEWTTSELSFFYAVLSPIVRISGELAPQTSAAAADIALLSGEALVLGRFTLEAARMEYQNESTPWLELRLDRDDQQVVMKFVRELLQRPVN